MMMAESPIGCDYTESPITTNKLKPPKTLPSHLPPKKIKPRRGILKQSQSESESKKKAQQNYFDKINKQIKIKTYSNLFMRKLKQVSTLNQHVTHELLQSEEQERLHMMRTVLINPDVEIGFTILDVVQTFITCIVTSLAIAFPQLRNSDAVNNLSMLTAVFCLANILQRFLTRSSIDVKNENKNYEYVREAIFEGLDRQVLIDIGIMLIFFIDFLSGFTAAAYLKMTIIIKLVPAMKKITNLQILLISNCFRQQYWALAKVFIFNYIFAHFIAVVLILMGANHDDSWLVAKDLVGSPWYQQYIWAYYWATTIMLTVGFGDIVPRTSQEALIMVFIESLSCIVLAYNINSVGSIIKKITSYQQQKISNFKTFTQMQGKQNISEDIKDKITNYITQSAQLKRNFNAEEQQKLIEKLPRPFFEQFKKESNSHIFNTVPFFRNLSMKKLREIALRIDKKLTHPQEIIVESNTVPDIYLVNNGHITFTLNRLGHKCHGKEVQSFKVQRGQFRLLSMYFFIGKQITYDIKCKDYAIVYSISRKQLQNILSANSSSYQYYCTLRDKDRFNPNDWEVQKCQVCGNQIHHTIFQCPKLHYMPLKDIVISRYKTKYLQKLKRNTINEWKMRQNKPNIQPLRHKAELLLAWTQLRSQGCILNSDSHHIPKLKKPLPLNLNLLFDQTPSQNTIEKLSEYSSTNQSNLSSSQQPNHHDSDINANTNIDININDIFREVGEKLKTQIIKTATYGLQELELDLGRNYVSYFHKFNPSQLAVRFSGRNWDK